MICLLSIRAQVRYKIQSITIEPPAGSAENRGYKFPLLFVPYFFTSRAIICVNGEYVSSEKSQIDAKRVTFIINVSAMRAIIGLESSTRAKRVFHLVNVKKYIHVSLHDLPFAFRAPSALSSLSKEDAISSSSSYHLSSLHSNPQLRAAGENLISRFAFY